jgi:hypothetical protein
MNPLSPIKPRSLTLVEFEVVKLQRSTILTDSPYRSLIKTVWPLSADFQANLNLTAGQTSQALYHFFDNHPHIFVAPLRIDAHCAIITSERRRSGFFYLLFRPSLRRPN